ncbi:MAG: alkaline phosphatase family protein [Thermodesulfobacteriota bacterium]
MGQKRVVVIDVVGLRPDHFAHPENMPNLAKLADTGTLMTMKPVFPAVTLPVQASLTTGVFPETHGVVSNGFYFPEHHQVSFWEQASGLVRSEKIWERLHRKDSQLKTAVLFFQNSLYADCEAVITPKPLHTDDGLVQWCYSKPVGLYESISEKIDPFNLYHFWGPMASIEGSRWIAESAVEVMDRIRPHLMFVYLPHLDYSSQKVGPDDPSMSEELRQIDQEVGRIVQGVDALGMKEETIFIVLSEYAFHAVQGDVALNRVLRENDLLCVRTIAGREYLDFELSPAFAMVDHQTAHLYIKPGRKTQVRQVLEQVEGIDFLMDTDEKQNLRIDHPRSGDLVAVSARDRWFSYYWWLDSDKAPDFANRVDIHRKPGYDPLEMFLEPGTHHISQDTRLIQGSHGYPPVDERDRIPLLISGQWRETAGLSEDLSVPDVFHLIEGIFNDD